MRDQRVGKRVDRMEWGKKILKCCKFYVGSVRKERNGLFGNELRTLARLVETLGSLKLLLCW